MNGSCCGAGNLTCRRLLGGALVAAMLRYYTSSNSLKAAKNLPSHAAIALIWLAVRRWASRMALMMSRPLWVRS